MCQYARQRQFNRFQKLRLVVPGDLFRQLVHQRGENRRLRAEQRLRLPPFPLHIAALERLLLRQLQREVVFLRQPRHIVGRRGRVQQVGCQHGVKRPARDFFAAERRIQRLDVVGIDADLAARTQLAQEIHPFQLIYTGLPADVYAIHLAILIPDQAIRAPCCAKLVKQRVRRTLHHLMGGFLDIRFRRRGGDVQPQFFD